MPLPAVPVTAEIGVDAIRIPLGTRKTGPDGRVSFPVFSRAGPILSACPPVLRLEATVDGRRILEERIAPCEEVWGYGYNEHWGDGQPHAKTARIAFTPDGIVANVECVVSGFAR